MKDKINLRFAFIRNAFSFLAVALFLVSYSQSVAAQNKVKVIKPSSIYQMPKISVAEFKKLDIDALSEEEFDKLEKKYGDLAIYFDLYVPACSWYCGGDVKKVTASSCLSPIKQFTYEGKNAHDFDLESVWSTKGNGVGQSLTYTFDGACPRITTVQILNGHVKTETAWKSNSRVKKLRIWYEGKPYADLELEDSRSLQVFDVGILGYNDNSKPEWTLKFEILEIYPGTKYKDTVIAELYFDGIDVH